METLIFVICNIVVIGLIIWSYWDYVVYYRENKKRMKKLEFLLESGKWTVSQAVFGYAGEFVGLLVRNNNSRRNCGIGEAYDIQKRLDELKHRAHIEPELQRDFDQALEDYG